MTDTAKSLRKVLPENALIEDLFERISEFVKQVPLVWCFNTHGKNSRHWEKISEVVGFAVSPEKELTLKRLIELEVVKHLGRLEEISRLAEREWSFEKNLLDIINFWQDVRLRLESVYEDHVFSRRQMDDLMASLSDHIIRINSMRSSQFAQYIEQKLEYWQNWLHFTQDLLPAILECQRQYIRVLPLFFNSDAIRFLNEGKWKEVLQKWRFVIKMCQTYPRIVDFTKQRDMISLLHDNNRLFGHINKSVANYCQSKRMNYNRLFLLDDDSIIALFTNFEWKVIQSFIPVLYSNLHSLTMQEKQANGMLSLSQEKLVFMSSVDLANYSASPEHSLVAIEKYMCEAIKENLQKTHQDYQSLSSQP